MEHEQAANPPAQAPELWPLVRASARPQFAKHGSLAFGWQARSEKRRARFHLQKLSPIRGWVLQEEWPLTELGLVNAWAVLRSRQPRLAARVIEAVGVAEQDRVRLEREDAARRAAVTLERERSEEGEIGKLANCVLLGGYGVEGLRAGDRVDLHFTRKQVWLTKRNGSSPCLRVGYTDARTLEFEGGILRSGGGYVGGGFGILGAAEGMAMASLFNSLTSKTSVQTMVRFEAVTAEVFLFTDEATPKVLEMRFSEVRGRIRAQTPPPARTHPAASGGDWSEQLVRLGEMHEKGLLSAEEFAAAKAKLLS